MLIILRAWKIYFSEYYFDIDYTFARKQKPMQISIDIRGYDTSTIYGRFVTQTLSHLVSGDKKNTYIIYTHHTIETEVSENTKFVSTTFKSHNFFGQLQFKKLLEKDNSHLYFFFDEYVPLGFSKDFMVIIPNLQEVFFPTLKGLKKYYYHKNLKNSTDKAQKIFCFDTNTALELNEKVNVREEKISVIPGFFFSQKPKIDTTDIKLNIKAKHSINGEYLLYDAGNDSHHNFERVLKVFERLKNTDKNVALVILCEDTTKDINLRQQVLASGIEKNVFFLGGIDPTDEIYYYGQSAGVIFSWFYNSFPFCFWKAILYDTPIIASDLKSTREIMKNEISYFNSRSTSEALEGIEQILSLKKWATNYKKLHERLNAQNTANTIRKSIASWESHTWK